MKSLYGKDGNILHEIMIGMEGNYQYFYDMYEENGKE